MRKYIITAPYHAYFLLIPASFVIREDVWDEFTSWKHSLDFRHIGMVASVSQIHYKVPHHYFFVVVRHRPFIWVIDAFEATCS